MSKILVISDDMLLSQLYVTNLEVYLGSIVLVVNSIDEAKVIITANQDINLIISLSTIKEINIVQGLQEIFSENDLIIPIISVGNSEIQDENVVEVKNYYGIQNIIRSAAKILGVTAKSMVNKETPKYYPIDIDFFDRIKKAPANFYLEIKKESTICEYEAFLKKDAMVDKVINKLKIEGVKQVFVNSNDRLLVINSISVSICEAITLRKLVTAQEKSSAIATSMEFVASSIVNKEISSEIVNLANVCSKVMTEVISDSHDLKSLLQLFLTNKNGYAYMHSMLAAYVAAHVVKNVPWGGESHIEKINFVLFFHDVPLAPIYLKYPHLKGEEDLLFSEELSDQEKDIVLNHARISAEMVAGLKKCPIGADLLIRQHHGMGNGIGFAIQYRDDISPLSKVIIIAEAFVEDLMKLKDQNEKMISVSEIMQNLSVKFPKHTYKKIIETLTTLKI